MKRYIIYINSTCDSFIPQIKRIWRIRLQTNQALVYLEMYPRKVVAPQKDKVLSSKQAHSLPGVHEYGTTLSIKLQLLIYP